MVVPPPPFSGAAFTPLRAGQLKSVRPDVFALPRLKSVRPDVFDTAIVIQYGFPILLPGASHGWGSLDAHKIQPFSFSLYES